jgi:hypothetical protein
VRPAEGLEEVDPVRARAGAVTQKRGALGRQRRVRVRDRAAHRPPVLDGQKVAVARPREVVANDGPRAAVVDPTAGELFEEVRRALRRQPLERARDEPPLFAPLPGRRAAARREQVRHDERLVEMVDAAGERPRVERAIVAEHVFVQKFYAEPLLGPRFVKLVPARAGVARVQEGDEVFARDALAGR